MSAICAGVSGNRWHAAVGAAVADHGSDQLAVLIVEHERRAQQARPAVAAAVSAPWQNAQLALNAARPRSTAA